MKQRNPNTDEPSSAGQHERRHVYNGDSMKQHGNSPKGNHPVRSRKRSPFTIVLGLFCLSLMVVLYIWNKISVNKLAIAVNDLHNQHEKILNKNEFLRVEINKKSSLERIGKIAVEQLGLVSPKEQPIWFEINQAGFEEVKKTQ